MADGIEQPIVTYYPESGYLYIETGQPLGVGQSIAKDVVVFHHPDDMTKIVGIRIGEVERADVILEPFLEAAKDRRIRAGEPGPERSPNPL